MLKMLSESIGFISNNVKVIQSFEKIITFFEYLKKTVTSCDYFSIGDTPPYMMGKKRNDKFKGKNFLTRSKQFLWSCYWFHW